MSMVVPKESRIVNKVDPLNDRIRRIQSVCQHEFRLEAPVKLSATAVSNVITVGAFSTTCLHCSLEQKNSAHEICPRCLSPVKEHEAQAWSDYFPDTKEGLYRVRLFKCTNVECATGIVARQWDK